jgi:hypothetical protein
MGHLTPGELVDLAEGSRDAASLPHLMTCDRCQRQLADLRLMISVGDLKAGGEVPEPSPLFWDHLSARVHDSIGSDALPTRAALLRFWPRVTMAALVVVLVSAIVAGLGSRLVAPGSQSGNPPVPARVGQPGETGPDVQVALPPLLASPDDPSLSLVADYGGTLGWDELRAQMAVPAHPGGLDATVGELNAGERQELHRLLKEELARPAARTDRS